MISTNEYKDLPEFLSKHNISKKEKNENTEFTHTRIGDPTKRLNIYPASYCIPKDKKKIFYNLYYEHIFVKKKMEYLTERQLENIGPILIDFDFRYSYDVENRQHTQEQIQDIINVLYLEELKEFFIFDENKSFPIYVMEKPHVNRVQEDNVTKDGIHFYFGIQMDNVMQQMLRERVLLKIADYIELPIINTWDKVIDEGISKGKTNWTLYGSRKPNHEAYELTQYFEITYDKTDGEFMMIEKSIKDFNFEKDFIKLTAQYEDNVKFDINPKIVDEYNKRKSGGKPTKIKKSSSKTRVVLLEDEENEDYISIEDITNEEILKKAIDNIMKELKPDEYVIKEIHEYTQILPAKYYEPGSHLLNRQVAFALKDKDERLFLSWIMLRSKASDFNYDSIPDLYMKWKKHFNKTDKNSECLTYRSIMYWAKQDAYEEYMKIKKNTVDYFVEQTLISSFTEFDIATVLFHLFKDKYVCPSMTSRQWYTFKNHRWVPDLGQSLRLAISRDLFNVYLEKQDQLMVEKNHFSENDERQEYINKRARIITELTVKLKKTTDKNNIMREAMELFYDKDFNENMDKNPYLMCFTNGVIDFKNKVFRNGYPQDYITKCTKIPYVEFDINNEEHKIQSEQIHKFMNQLFPEEDLKNYMWEHAASCLIGVNKNQTFNIYRGSGSNGKSIFTTDLMSKVLGEYKEVVPITLVTEKRVAMGGTCSEVIKLKGIRYAVLQETTKGCKLNEGIMKELTGGDPIQARGLYCESESFIPQFKLVVCTNVLFDIDSNDDGTWRRIRLVDFKSKFVNENEKHTDDTPYVFPKDKELEEKVKVWAPLFAGMLVKKAFETNGIVKDCDIVLSSSSKYRDGQDHIAGFVKDKIIKTDNVKDKIKKNELTNEFKIWFQGSQGARRMPKGSELYEYMDKKFGKCKNTGWQGVKIIYEEKEDELNEIKDDDE